MTHKFHMISFYSEGYPHDNGLNLEKEANRLKEWYSNEIDSFTLYNPRSLKEMGYTIIDYSKDPKYNMQFNKGYSAVGLGYWRPLILYLKLKEINYGDIIYQQDCNVSKYPLILEIKHRLLVSGAAAALMSGSGSTVFGLVTSRTAEDRIKEVFSKTKGFWVWSGSTLVRRQGQRVF